MRKLLKLLLYNVLPKQVFYGTCVNGYDIQFYIDICW